MEYIILTTNKALMNIHEQPSIWLWYKGWWVRPTMWDWSKMNR